MSLAIKEEDVYAVLLADGWHEVFESTFVLDAFEITDVNEDLTHSGGQSGVCATGFRFSSHNKEGGVEVISGPLTSVIAVKEDRIG